MSDESERDFTLRLIQKMLDRLDRMKAATGGRDIRFDVPLAEQFDAATLDALAQAMDDRELEDMFAAMERTRPMLVWSNDRDDRGRRR